MKQETANFCSTDFSCPSDITVGITITITITTSFHLASCEITYVDVDHTDVVNCF